MTEEQKMQVDILVLGGGVAGCGAAITAARRGWNVLLVESTTSLGGLATNGLVTGIAGMNEGLCEEWLERLKQTGDMIDRPHLPVIDPDKGKIALEHMLLEAGGKLLYGGYAIDTEVEDGYIRAVICHTKSGRLRIAARMFVDATGDADIAAFSGVPCEVGSREFGGLNASTTLAFRMANVDLETYYEACRKWSEGFGCEIPDHISLVAELEEKAVAAGDLPQLIFPTALIYPVPNTPLSDADITVMSAHSFYARNTDAFDLTRQIVEQHDQITLLEKFFRKYMPGFARSRVTGLASLHGIRDSRRIVGEYVLKDTDVACAKKFDDAILKFPEAFDTHHPTTAKYGFISHIHVDEPMEPAVCRPACCDVEMHPDARSKPYEARVNPMEYCEIPYRCMVPLKIDNLLVAGRCMSAEFNALAAVRVIAPAMNSGYAAGIAADLCLKTNTTPRKLDGRLVRQAMIDEGVRLDHAPDKHWEQVHQLKGEFVVLPSDMVGIRTKEGIKTHI